MIAIKELTTGYRLSKGKHKIVHKQLNATIEKGKLICLIGANGSGKSTLIKTIGGFIKPIEGNIEIDGVNMNDISLNELSKKLGIVLSTTPYIDNIKAEEVVAMGRYPYCGMFGKLNNSDHDIIDEAIETIGISSLRNLYFNRMSDGERQKVMIAKTLAQQTPYIIMDEPMAYLDYPSRLNMMSMLRQLAEEYNKAIILSTHNLEMVFDLSDVIWITDCSGKFIVTTREEITPLLVKEFFDEQTAQYLL